MLMAQGLTVLITLLLLLLFFFQCKIKAPRALIVKLLQYCKDLETLLCSRSSLLEKHVEGCNFCSLTVLQYFQPPETPSIFGAPGSSKRIRHMRMAKPQSETLRTWTGEHSRIETIIPGRSQFSDDDTSSDDLTESVGEIKCLKLVKQEEQHPKYAVVSRGVHHRRVQAQKNVSPTAKQDNKVRKSSCKP